MMFWIGLIIGLFVGTLFGVLIIALCKAAANGDEQGTKDDYCG